MADQTPDSSATSATTTPAAAPVSAPSDMGGSASLPVRNFNSPQTVIPPPDAAQSVSQIPSSSQTAAVGAPSGMGGGGSPRQFNAPPQTIIPSPEHQLGAAMQQTAGAVQHVANSIGSDTAKPGSIWRTILSAALVGAAAGAGHGWKGMGEGAKAEQAVMDRQRQQVLDTQKEAREKRQDMIAKTREQREKTVAEATIANYHNEAINRTRTSDFMSDKFHADMNALNNTLFENLRQKGGVDPTDPNIPREIGAYELRDLVTQHPESMRPTNPDYVRIYIDTTDGSEHTFAEINWKDKDGKDIDMTNHTKFRVMDLPTKDVNTKVMTPNESINAVRGLATGAAGTLPAGGKTAWSMQDDMTARSKASEELNRKAEADLRINESKLKLGQLELDIQKLKQMSTTENHTALMDSIGVSKSFSDSLKDRLNDPLVPAADKEKYRKQIDVIGDVIFKALGTAHKGLSLSSGKDSSSQSVSEMDKIVGRYTQGVPPAVSTTLTTAATQLQNGTPLSDVLETIGKSKLLSPADMNTVIKTLPKMAKEMAPLSKEAAAAYSEATNNAKSASAGSWAEEHPEVEEAARHAHETYMP